MSIAQRPGTFYATVVGATGLFTAPGAAPAPAQNPVSTDGLACVPARTGAGVYTLTFSQAKPTTEYMYSMGVIGGAGNANIQFAVAGAVVNITTFVVAVATDENFWILIEPITG